MGCKCKEYETFVRQGIARADKILDSGPDDIEQTLRVLHQVD